MRAQALVALWVKEGQVRAQEPLDWLFVDLCWMRGAQEQAAQTKLSPKALSRAV